MVRVSCGERGLQYEQAAEFIQKEIGSGAREETPGPIYNVSIPLQAQITLRFHAKRCQDQKYSYQHQNKICKRKPLRIVTKIATPPRELV